MLQARASTSSSRTPRPTSQPTSGRRHDRYPTGLAQPLLATDRAPRAAAARPLPAPPMAPESPAFWVFSAGSSGRRRPWCIRTAPWTDRRASRSNGWGWPRTTACSPAPRLFFTYPLVNVLLAGLGLGATVLLDASWPSAATVAESVAALRPTRAVQRAIAVPRPAAGRAGRGPAPRRRGALRLGRRSLAGAAARSLAAADRAAHDRRLRQCRDAGPGAHALPGDDALQPSPGVQALPLDPAAAAAGAPTRLLLQAATLAAGYHDRPQAQAEAFRDGSFCRPIFSCAAPAAAGVRRARGHAGEDPRPLGRPGRTWANAYGAGLPGLREPPPPACPTPTGCARWPSSCCRRCRGRAGRACRAHCRLAAARAPAVAALPARTAAHRHRQAAAPAAGVFFARVAP